MLSLGATGIAGLPVGKESGLGLKSLRPHALAALRGFAKTSDVPCPAHTIPPLEKLNDGELVLLGQRFHGG